MKGMLAGLAAIILAASPAMAQGHGGPGADSSRGMGMMHSQSSMMTGTAMGPDMVLRLQGSLDLTQSQISQLETSRDSARSVMRRHMMQAMQVVHTASELLDSDAPDLDAYEARFREATDHMVLAHMSAARAAAQARQVLTLEQRERLSLVREMTHEMHPGTTDDGMMDCRMMSHGGG